MAKELTSPIVKAYMGAPFLAMTWISAFPLTVTLVPFRLDAKIGGLVVYALTNTGRLGYLLYS